MLSCHICKHIRDKVFKSGLSKFCGRLPLKNLKGLGRPYPFNFLKTVVLHKFYLVHYWILCLICWVWETGCITSALKVHPSDFGLGVIGYVFWIWKNPSNNSLRLHIFILAKLVSFLSQSGTISCPFSVRSF